MTVTALGVFDVDDIIQWYALSHLESLTMKSHQFISNVIQIRSSIRPSLSRSKSLTANLFGGARDYLLGCFLTQAEPLSSNSLLFLKILRIGTQYKLMVAVNVFLNSEKQFANNGIAMRKSNIDYALSKQQYI